MKKKLLILLVLSTVAHADEHYILLKKRKTVSTVTIDALQEIESLETTEIDGSCAQLCLDIQKIMGDLSHSLGDTPEAEEISRDVAQLIAMLVQEAVQLQINEQSAVKAKKTDQPTAVTVQTPVVDEQKRIEAFTKELVTIIAELATSATVIATSPKNPKVLAPGIAGIIANIMKLIKAIVHKIESRPQSKQ